MTREKAIKCLEGFNLSSAKCSMAEAYEALDMAIKALEGADLDGYFSRLWKAAYERGKAEAEPKWIPVSERFPEYGVAVLTYDGICYCVEKRIPAIRDKNGESIFGEWWVSDDYDESNSEYYPNLRDGACIAWMPLPETYKAESEEV